ncbi:hypothetical protein GCM10007028_34980 [Algibacter mikhailovii]|uniref:Uncharacterized protein n=1 Tax=Algibacter mikhailovii TaxID=425498 RepID=A0A918VEU4_9FLAO|nr:hypothetical protein GCM10007028_34980 [Algibacter mikhailovii]
MITMGKNSRKLIENKYSMKAVAKDMITLYKRILKEGEKPKFVSI